MSTVAFIMMVLILVAVWGGFAFAIRTAMKREAQKSQANDQ